MMIVQKVVRLHQYNKEFSGRYLQYKVYFSFSLKKLSSSVYRFSCHFVGLSVITYRGDTIVDTFYPPGPWHSTSPIDKIESTSNIFCLVFDTVEIG